MTELEQHQLYELEQKYSRDSFPHPKAIGAQLDGVVGDVEILVAEIKRLKAELSPKLGRLGFLEQEETERRKRIPQEIAERDERLRMDAIRDHLIDAVRTVDLPEHVNRALKDYDDARMFTDHPDLVLIEDCITDFRRISFRIYEMRKRDLTIRDYSDKPMKKLEELKGQIEQAGTDVSQALSAVRTGLAVRYELREQFFVAEKDAFNDNGMSWYGRVFGPWKSAEYAWKDWERKTAQHEKACASETKPKGFKFKTWHVYAYDPKKGKFKEITERETET